MNCFAHPELGNHEGGHPNSILESSQVSLDLGSLGGLAQTLTQPVAYLRVNTGPSFSSQSRTVLSDMANLVKMLRKPLADSQGYAK